MREFLEALGFILAALLLLFVVIVLPLSYFEGKQEDACRAHGGFMIPSGEGHACMSKDGTHYIDWRAKP